MPTIKEVAASAGVSPSTVSNVFLGRVPVRDSTKQRVLSAARRLGYQPDGLAQALRTGRTRTLGLLVPHITNPTIAAMVNGATREAQAAGYAVSVCAIENDPRLQETYLDLLRRERVAAVIAQPAGEDAEPYAAFQRAGAFLVFVDRRPAGVDADYVTRDYRTATRDATRHLIQTGRRRIALLTGPRWIDSTRERIAGYEAAHIEAGLPVDDDLVATPDRRRGPTPAESIAGFLRRQRSAASGADAGAGAGGTRLDAIIAGSADVTLTALAALYDLGIHVPRDVALVGTGQVDWAPFAAPPLSVIEIDGGEIGRLAVSLALARIREAESAADPRPSQTIVLPARLTLRESSQSASHSSRETPA
jgi:LacI family transcriptional regulator